MAVVAPLWPVILSHDRLQRLSEGEEVVSEFAVGQVAGYGLAGVVR